MTFGKVLADKIENSDGNVVSVADLIDGQPVDESVYSTLSAFDRGGSVKTYEPKKVGIITAGQSNTNGMVPLATLPPSWYNPLIPDIAGTKLWNNTAKLWEPWTVPTWWAYDSCVYNTLAAYLPDDIYIMKRSMGGTAISEKAQADIPCWQPFVELLPDGVDSLTLEFEEYIRNALDTADTEGFGIKMFLWHQGESDSLTTDAQVDYYVNLRNLISYVRGVVGNATLPFVFGSISHASVSYSAVIEAAHFKIASEDANAYIVDMSNGTLMDPWHFDAVSSESLGDQMSQIIINNILT